uniref:Eco57I restriction-modification methylase domain-containing protein n=1 Tax=Ligilactobacillus sp. TaxID=2767921 RepID=UPI002FE39BF5
MESNFDFLMVDEILKPFYKKATDMEKNYAEGQFGTAIATSRTIVENVAKEELDQAYVELGDRDGFNDFLRKIKSRKLAPENILDKFYMVKRRGNEATHEMDDRTKEEALKVIGNVYDILKWFSLKHNPEYADQISSQAFVEPKKDPVYQTAERKVIYVQNVDRKMGIPAYEGAEKVGETSVDDFEIDATPNSDDLHRIAEKRVKSYMTTSGLRYEIPWVELAYRKKDRTWFRDSDVHTVLRRSGIRNKPGLEGNEWFETDVETVKDAIKAVKEGKNSIEAPIAGDGAKIVLRPEQEEAIVKTQSCFRKKDRMLWNAKMRFGKTITALELIKRSRYQHVLIMTHRPVVDEGWFADFKKVGLHELGYLYGSKQRGSSLEDMMNSSKPYIYFASLQDLRGSELVGGRQGDKNRELFDNDWDLVIVDEAHEGTQTDLAKRVMEKVVGESTKVLELSGTPFNIIDQYDEDQVFVWDYTMEQRAKRTWKFKHPEEKNPYAELPAVQMYTFEMSRQFKDACFLSDDRKSFNFKEFFRVDENGEFVYEDNVRQFLRNITTPDSKNNYPFSTKEFRDNLRHTLWILPGIKEADALEKLLRENPVFGMDYAIVNVVHNGDNENGLATDDEMKMVRDAIGPNPENTRTITLTVRKMTTGVTVREWTGVLFLSNTNSAMQYLQAAFRAQTPYSSEEFGVKTNCYIFDFAPDRALTVMAEASRLNTGVGKLTTGEQRRKMGDLLNFLPIIGEHGQGMKPYDVDDLLTQIKRVYAEKAVRTGFDDDSIYSDAMLMLNDADVRDFNDLKAIVGQTRAEKKKLKVDVNSQGLTEDEYNKATKGKKKPRKERSAEEQEAIEKMNELKKQRKTMISILRSVSIRIPMLIYGMDIDIDKDVDIRKFVKLVDDKSWAEFMPNGVTKELFRKFIKYYDPEVFIEAGRIIRRRVKALDSLDPMERVEKIAEIFGTFRNVDKETVLTPWRVVNMHMGKTIGGYSFYDDNYNNTTVEGKNAAHWVNTEYTDRIFRIADPQNNNVHILEINSKTGLYPLYATMSLYYCEYMKMVNESAGKFSLEDERRIWQKILRENIFVVAKTKMAKTITQRTLAGYLDMDTNVEFVDNIVEDAKEDAKKEARKIEGIFGGMKFDVVIGNPPYQAKSKGKQEKYAPPIYNEFMDLSYNLADIVTLITPARFLFDAGSTPKSWNRKMLDDEHFKVV